MNEHQGKTRPIVWNFLQVGVLRFVDETQADGVVRVHLSVQWAPWAIEAYGEEALTNTVGSALATEYNCKVIRGEDGN
jgi:hypothetical protein